MRPTRPPVARIAIVLVGAATAAAGVFLAPPTATADDRAATSISVRAEAARVDPGASTVIRGHLRVPGEEAAGRAVSLEARPAGTTGFTPVGTATAGENGGLRASVTPETTTRYRWTYAGAEDARPRTSAVVQVRVAERSGTPQRLATTLSIRLVNPPAPGRVRVVVGRLRSDRTELPNRRVQLVARAAGASRWHFVRQQRTGDGGQVRFTVRPRGATAYRLTYLGSQVFRPSRSGVARVAAPPRAATSLSIRGRDGAEGFVVSGALRGGGRPVPGVWVALESLAPGGTEYAEVAATRTARRGGVVFRRAAAPGTSYRLVFDGNRRFTASTSGVVVD